MTTIRRCDRCGAEVMGARTPAGWHIGAWDHERADHTHICPECITARIEEVRRGAEADMPIAGARRPLERRSRGAGRPPYQGGRKAPETGFQGVLDATLLQKPKS